MRRRHGVGAALAVAAVVLAGTGPLPAAGAAPPGPAGPSWAPPGQATITPGVQIESSTGQCTANFVFRDPANPARVLLGQAAHCTALGGPTATNGCRTRSLPLGTRVRVEGASRKGVMVYNSWLAMQAVGETDPGACAYNDLALLEIHPADAGRVNPSVPHWGGPVAGRSAGAPSGQAVYSYGNSSLRLGLSLLSPKSGLSLGPSAGGWSHRVYTVTPGIPGDSGSAFLDATGRALGVLSTLQVAPLPAANGVGDLGRQLDYLRAHTRSAVEVVPGTEPFTPGRLPLRLTP